METGTLDYDRFGEISIILESEIEKHKRLHSRKAEPWTVEWLERCLEPGACLYDIGANVGTFSLIAAAILHGRDGGDGQVVAIEPAYPTFHRLCQNIVTNARRATIIPLCLALGAHGGIADLQLRTEDAGEARHKLRLDKKSMHERTDKVSQRIPVFALDHLLESLPLPRPSLLKIDVDGFEAPLLEGAAQTLADPSLEHVLIEVEEKEQADFERRFEAAGFKQVAAHQSPRGKGRVCYLEFDRP